MVSIGPDVYRHEQGFAGSPPVIRSLSLEGVSPWTRKQKKNLSGGSLVIGQSQRWLRIGGLRIQSDPHVRLIHAEIKVGGNQYFIHPYAPTFINGKAIFAPTALKPGQTVTVGRSSFVVRGGKNVQLKEYQPAPNLKETFSMDDQRRYLRFLQSPSAVHHPHLQQTFAAANLLPEGRALRYGQLLSEIQANMDFLKNHAQGRLSLVAPDRSIDFPVKHTMRSILDGHVNQPDFAAIHYEGRDPTSQRLKLSSESFSQALELLRRHGELYLKPSDSSSSFGVSRIARIGGRLEVFSTHNGYLDRLARLPGARRSSAKIVSLPAGALRQRFHDVLSHFDAVISRSQGPDTAILEAGIPIPKIKTKKGAARANEKPKTWEIRSFHQQVDGQGKITYQYAKVGSGSETAAIAKGGSRADALETVKNVYRQHKPGLSPAVVDILAAQFIGKVNAATAKVVSRMNVHLRQKLGVDQGRYPLGSVDIAHLVVDFTGQFDSKGRLQPVLMEINKVGSLHPNAVVEHRTPHRILKSLMAREARYLSGLKRAA